MGANARDVYISSQKKELKGKRKIRKALGRVPLKRK
jgi:hypothetical protein